MKRLAVVGFGQMGASLAAGWKARGLRILAIDADPEVRRKSIERNLADDASADVRDCAQADAVLLAVPVRTAVQILPGVLASMRDDALLLDVASTKGVVVEAYRRIGRPVHYVSFHPLAGTEGAGIDSADPAIFRDAPFLILPIRATPRILDEVESWVRELGARPIRMESAEEHDRAMATTVHLPHVLAYALAHVGKDDLELAGRSYRDSTRVALSDVRMVLDFLLTNGPRTAEAIDRLIARLVECRERLRTMDEPGLRAFMEEAKAIRAGLK